MSITKNVIAGWAIGYTLAALSMGLLAQSKPQPPVAPAVKADSPKATPPAAEATTGTPATAGTMAKAEDDTSSLPKEGAAEVDQWEQLKAKVHASMQSSLTSMQTVVNDFDAMVSQQEQLVYAKQCAAKGWDLPKSQDGPGCRMDPTRRLVINTKPEKAK